MASYIFVRNNNLTSDYIIKMYEKFDNKVSCTALIEAENKLSTFLGHIIKGFGIRVRAIEDMNLDVRKEVDDVYRTVTKLHWDVNRSIETNQEVDSIQPIETDFIRKEGYVHSATYSLFKRFLSIMHRVNVLAYNTKYFPHSWNMGMYKNPYVDARDLQLQKFLIAVYEKMRAFCDKEEISGVLDFYESLIEEVSGEEHQRAAYGPKLKPICKLFKLKRTLATEHIFTDNK